jgi:HSP20 family molecular chaperone IbpA
MNMMNSNYLIDRLFNDVTMPSPKWMYKKENDELVAQFNVAGFDKDTIEVIGENNHTDGNGLITIKSKGDVDGNDLFIVKPLEQNMYVGKDYDAVKSKALIKNGILTLRIPKKEEAKDKRVTIAVK